jgi:hypothetical protein
VIRHLLAMLGFAAAGTGYHMAQALSGTHSFAYPIRDGKSGVAAVKRAAKKARNKRRARRA